MPIYIASDHGGINLKTIITEHLKFQNKEFVDMGPKEKNPQDDYPDFVIPAMKKLQENPISDCAILICRNGVGVNILANKFNGVRAGLSWNPQHAKTHKEDDHTNVLTLPADFVSEREALEIVDLWLNSKYSDEPRHNRRLQKIADFEGNLPEENL